MMNESIAIKKAMQITSELVYLEVGAFTVQLDEAFKGTFCRSAQDLYRSIFFHQPVFICRIDGELEAYAVIELHSLKRASLWHGPIIKNNLNTEVILHELRKCALANGIWQLMIYPLNFEVTQGLSSLFARKLVFKLGSSKGATVAVKDISQPKEAILKSYRRSLKDNLKKASKHQVEIVKITTQETFEEWVELVLGMYAHKGIQINKTATRTLLINEYRYIQETKRGEIVGAKYDGKLVGGEMHFITRNVVALIHAATDKNVKLPILQPIVNQVILEAHENGVQFCDFGAMTKGNDQADAKEQKDWDGFTYYKTTFGIDVVEYPDTLSLALTFKAWVFFKCLNAAKFMTNLLTGKRRRSAEFGYARED